tara:strand:+ start:16460 stop:17092 length:633 start_codon:yes stop_codon:yes gene_type:complete
MKLKKIDFDKVTLESYQKYITNDKINEEELVKCFLNINGQELKKIPLIKVDLYIAQITQMLDEKNQDLVRTFTLNGVEYGFIPNLDKITYGENADVTRYISDYGTMHKAMAVLYRPIIQKQKDKYLIEDYEGSYKYAIELKQMPIKIVFGAIVFFYRLTKKLSNAILNFLSKEATKDYRLKQVLAENGEDIQNSIRLVKETFKDLIPLRN